MTTIDGSRFLGREQTMGSVAVGKQADLVVLDANPLERIANLHGIAGVMRAGTYFAKPALDAMKAQTAARMVAYGHTSRRCRVRAVEMLGGLEGVVDAFCGDAEGG